MKTLIFSVLCCKLGVNIESRWNDIYEVCKSHIGDHTLAFHDTHILMSCLGAKQKETSNAMMESIQVLLFNLYYRFVNMKYILLLKLANVYHDFLPYLPLIWVFNSSFKDAV